MEVRIIVATHRDLELRIADGSFRADLYYRLAVFPLRLAPLRDRPEDLPLLVAHFLRGCRERLGSAIEEVDPAVMERLARHGWPGNVRELRNVVERAALMASPDARVWRDPPDFGADFSAPCRRGAEKADGDGDLVPWPKLVGMPLKEAVEHIESQLIRRHLLEASGNLAHAATRLGMPRRTLSYKIRRYGITEA